MKEIERKYKILGINKKELESILRNRGLDITKFKIAQYYLNSDDYWDEIRVRKITCDHKDPVYIETCKGKEDLSKGVLSRDEFEIMINSQIFSEKIKEATHLLYKERWLIEDGISIDFITTDTIETLILLEIEFPSILMSKFVTLDSIRDYFNGEHSVYTYIIDVTSDSRYRSKNLASPIKSE